MAVPALVCSGTASHRVGMLQALGKQHQEPLSHSKSHGTACSPLLFPKRVLLSKHNSGGFKWAEANTLSLCPAASILITTNKDGLAKGRLGSSCRHLRTALG